MRRLILAAALLAPLPAMGATEAIPQRFFCADLHITVLPGHAPDAATRAAMRAELERVIAYAVTCTPQHPMGKDAENMKDFAR